MFQRLAGFCVGLVWQCLRVLIPLWLVMYLFNEDFQSDTYCLVFCMIILVTSLEDKIKTVKTELTELHWFHLGFAGNASKPTNLRFEGEVIHGLPVGWCDGFRMIDGVSTLYDFEVEPRVEGSVEKCVRVHRTSSTDGEFGSLMQRWPAHTLAGRRIRIEADIRTEDLDAMAGLWFRIDDDSSMVSFDNMSDRPIQGTTPWNTYSQETEVPEDAEWLSYGFLLVGNGSLWAADVRVSVCDDQGQWAAVC